ncbi:hypothetical protein LIER_37622 [Lithospermum erythrorhizon]|uniref:Uncharacterized protein n=1 Tax=Lithospermum erythrorhizon TaxID=34254 RepID=A0AAV3PN04_LITER
MEVEVKREDLKIKLQSRDGQPMSPLTVKQISGEVQSDDDKSSFLVNGTRVTNVKLVGMVYNKSVRVTDASFVLDDGTGRVECTRWMNDSADTDEVEGFADEMYVRVYGHLKLYQGKKQVVAFAIRCELWTVYCVLSLIFSSSSSLHNHDYFVVLFMPICDYNEIASHFLECVFMHAYNAKVANLTSTTAPAPANSAISSNHSSGHQPASSTHSVEQYSLDGLKDMEKKIIGYLEQPSSVAQEKGVHRDEIAQQLKLPSDKIFEAMQSLESEGLVYSTVDECHFKSTSS